MVAWILILRYSTDAGLQSTPYAGKIALVFGPGLVLAIGVLLIGYVNGDARRRGMRYVMWTLLAIFIPNAVGIILYFILRDPILKPCPQCGHIVRPGFTFCPHCGTSLQPTCPNCGKGVEPGWPIARSAAPNCRSSASRVGDAARINSGLLRGLHFHRLIHGPIRQPG